MADLIKRLSEVHGVSGGEDSARKLIIDAIRDKVDDITVDTMGNVIAFKKGKTRGKTIVVTASMDEVGLIISEITDKGYLKFKLVGNIDARKLISKRVITRGGVKGVIGLKAIHLRTRSDCEVVTKPKDLFIDIGAKDKEDAQKRVHLGEYVTFDTSFGDMGECVKGKALERSATCSVLINALQGEYPHDFYAVFTVQREVGMRGAWVIAHRLNADVALTVTAADTVDAYGCEAQGIRLGDGVTVSYRDAKIIGDRELTDKLLVAAKNDGIRAKGGVTSTVTDGGAMYITDTRIISALMPCRYAQSPVSVMNKSDIEETEKFIKLYLNKIGELI